MTEATWPQLANPLSWLCPTCPIAARLGECRAVHPKYHTKAPLKYLIVGEAPGENEEQKGQPFIGKAGKKLRAILKDAGISLDDCLFTNSCWCGPRSTSGGKIDNPTHEEALYCIPHAVRLIAKYRPQLVIAAGGVAASALTAKPKRKITTIRGHVQQMKFSVDTRYLIFHLWQTENQEAFATANISPLPFIAASEQEARAAQLQQATEQFQYSEEWLTIPLMPVFHPSYVIRSGAGGRNEEALKFDLIKARGLVEKVDKTHAVETNYRWITKLEEWASYVDETLAMKASGDLPHIAVDLETSEDTKDHGEIGLMAYDPETVIWTIQFSRASGEAVAVMVNHRESTFNDGPSFQQFRHHLERLISIDQPGHIPVIGQNITFDANVLRCFLGIRCEVVGDTMLMGHFLDMGKGLSQGLDHLGARFLGTGMLHKGPADDWRKNHPGQTFENMPLEIALGYAAGDADVTFRLYQIIREKLEAEGRWQSYYDIHHGLHKGWNVVNDMEWSGMPVDKVELDKLSEEYPRRIAALEPKLNNLAPIRTFNWMRLLTENAKRRAFNVAAEAEREEIRQLKARQEAEGVPKTRKRGSQNKKLYREDIEGFRDWMEDKKRWYNPNSSQQTVQMWRDVWKVPFELAECDDLEWNDECPRCNRAPCKCRKGAKFQHRTPKANEHNRNVLIASLEIWAERLRNPSDGSPPNEEGAQYWLDCADAIKTIDHYKMLTKMFGTYVGTPGGDKGIYPLIVDKPASLDVWEPSLRTSPLYAPYCNFPRPWSTHPSYLMHGTATGRLSSERPNGQNYPKRKMDPAANVKRPYISHWNGRGGLIVQPDYSQIEVRVMVMLCQDEEIARQINEGKDIHKVTASMVFGVPYDEVTKAQRGPCKNVTFGILYGQTVGALATALRITVKEAEALVKRFFEGLPKVKAFVDGMHEQVKQTGYVESLLGRRRYIPEVFEKDKGRSNAGLRMSVNTPIQSAASDLCWTAFGRSWQHLQRLNFGALPYSIIHDSQGVDSPPGTWMDVVELMYYHMVYEPYQLWDWITVKPEADFEIGAGWGRLVDMKLFFDGDQMDHNRVQFEGPQEDIDAVCVEIANGGQAYNVLEDHPHEKEEGQWVRQIAFGRENPKCWLHGRQLIEA